MNFFQRIRLMYRMQIQINQLALKNDGLIAVVRQHERDLQNLTKQVADLKQDYYDLHAQIRFLQEANRLEAEQWKQDKALLQSLIGTF